MSPLRETRVAWFVVAITGLVAVGAGLMSGEIGVWYLGASQAEPNPASTRGESTVTADVTLETRHAIQAVEPPEFAEARRRMVERQLRRRDITDARVLEVMGRIQRHRFVGPELQADAYDDRPWPIGHGQTISQPYIVALMTQLAGTRPGARVLDIGTGSGYQAAILAELCKEVYSIEIVEPLADEARKRLADLGYKNVTVRSGDGYRGWPEHAPFDIIIVAAAPDHVPQPLVDQLAPGGRLIVPVGGHPQHLIAIEKLQDGTVRRKAVAPVMFVPMTGEARQGTKKD